MPPDGGGTMTGGGGVTSATSKPSIDSVLDERANSPFGFSHKTSFGVVSSWVLPKVLRYVA